MNTIQRLGALPIGWLSRRPDVVLAVAIAGMISMLIVPLPTPVLDSLIAVNIAAGCLILMVALFSKSILDVSSFPSLLLLTTLFRLGLNVSTTRGILAEANAGEVVQAFGKFVVSGDVIVGLVIFLVITLVQFLVIAKGAERIAEVSARFTLDAMPGKQMSIDAALRRGIISEEEGQRKRDELDQASQMYGNMDGAMKFVKGDAIAGLVITALNLVAGLMIGVMRLGMPVSDALEVYTILTVGDGLVSQVSALFVTLSAGMIITRVHRDEHSNLGSAVKGEIFKSAKAVYVAAALMILLGLVPGLPSLPFLLIGFSLGLTNAFRQINDIMGTSSPATSPELRAARLKEKLDKKVADAKKQKSLSDRLAPSVLPIRIDLDARLTEVLGFNDGLAEETELLDVYVPQLRDALYFETGVRFPGVRVRTNVKGLGANTFRVLIKEVPALKACVPIDQMLALTPPENLSRLGVAARPITDPLNGAQASLIPANAKDVVESSGIVVWPTAGMIVLHLAKVLRGRSKDFVGLQEVGELIERMEAAYPTLVKEVIPKVVTLNQLVDVLRRLVDEGVSIRDMKTILESIGAHGGYESEGVWLTERVRSALSHQLAHSCAGPDRRLQAVLLDPVIEDTIQDGLQREPGGVSLCLAPEVTKDVIQSVLNAVMPMLKKGMQPTILTTTRSRRFVRRMLENDLPHVPVLSFEELPVDLVVQPMGRALLAA